MRLTCPNCGAQYEVPDEVIPASGRDVQCSECSNTWFQAHPDYPADEEPEQPEDQPLPESVPETAARRELDPAVANILREEAAHEAAVRAADASADLETQPDLGLNQPEDEAERRAREARTHMARLKGEEAAEEPTPSDDLAEPEHPDLSPGSRSNLLPDIEEINSSLESEVPQTTATHADARFEDPEPVRKSGFRRGFRWTILLAVLGLLLYVFAPQLAEAVPSTEGALSEYVRIIDLGRLWLDDMVANFMGMLEERRAESG